MEDSSGNEKFKEQTSAAVTEVKDTISGGEERNDEAGLAST